MHGVVSELACRSEMLGPSLGTGGEIVAPRERRNSNGRRARCYARPGFFSPNPDSSVRAIAEAPTTELSELPL